MKRLITLFIVLSALTLPANAQQQETIAIWYAGLKSADKSAFEMLMTEDAKIILKELQVVQTKTEYIESLDNWEEVIDDLRLTYSTDRVDAERIVSIVCYQFKSNSFTNRETFSFDEGKVFQLLQEKIKDEC